MIVHSQNIMFLNFVWTKPKTEAVITCHAIFDLIFASSSCDLNSNWFIKLKTNYFSPLLPNKLQLHNKR